ncbi:MAG: hypothetical protein CK604_06095 [Curvibacter sp. PD_MW3]|nr:MAG: hypothetical protein CK604_06095 [Curvibacter sp. PD_MW3]
MSKYLLDTNTVIHYLQERRPVVERLNAAPKGSIHTSSIVVMEFSTGFAKRGKLNGKNKKKLDDIFKKFPPIDFDELDAYETARTIGRMDLENREDLHRDMMIASQAKRRGYIAVTNNTTDFYKAVGTMVEDWTIDLSAKSPLTKHKPTISGKKSNRR